MEHTLRGVGRGTSTRCCLFVGILSCALGGLSLTRSVGDGRGRAEEALGSKPSGLCPKPEDLAERPCRTAALPGIAVGTALARAPSNQIWGPPSPAMRERDVTRPRGGEPSSSPTWHVSRGSPHGAGHAVKHACDSAWPHVPRSYLSARPATSPPRQGAEPNAWCSYRAAVLAPAGVVGD